jgi:septal ring factor EnvC (AmiA/AmiB activator)
MKIYYEPYSSEIIDDEFIEDASSVIAAIIEAENAVREGSPSSDKALNILSKQIERKQMRIKKLEAMIEKTERLNNLHRKTLASLEELHSKVKKRIDEAEDINTRLGRLLAVKGNSSRKK